jgi:DNA polymerase-3 subunit alpha
MLPIKVRSIYSVCRSVLKIDQIIDHCKSNGFEWCCLCDINTLSGAYDFHNACVKAGIKPVIGVELKLKSDEEGSVLLFAKNLKGWHELCELYSKANSNENFKSYPKVDIHNLQKTNNITIIVESEKTKDLIGDKATLMNGLSDIRVCDEESIPDLRLILASSMNTPLVDLKKKIDNNEVFECSEFFNNDVATFDKTVNDTKMFNDVELYKLDSPPVLPKCYEGDETQILRDFCRDGWKSRYENIWDKEVYGDRVKTELTLFEEYGLSGYFLIIKDLIDYARNNGWLTLARGSVGGSLIAYLLKISVVDPIKHKLLLARFFNPSRTDALPDIDVDIETEHREQLIDYLRSKYGEECVCQIVTFNKLKGSGALKEVLRMHKACDFSTANEITENMPEEAKISSKMKESGDDSIILWTLKTMPHIFKDYCTYDNGNFSGDYAEFFKQAIRIEGCIKSTGKHAAGILVSNKPLYKMFPMMHDPNSNFQICNIEYTKAEKMGGVKLDILGVSALSKIATVNKLLKFGKIPERNI